MEYTDIDFKGLSAYTVQNLIDRQKHEYDRRNREIREQEATRARTAKRNSMIAQLKKLGFSPATQNDWKQSDIDLDRYTDSEGYYGVAITPRFNTWSRRTESPAILSAKYADKKRELINRLRLSDLFELKVNITERKQTDWNEDRTDVITTGTYIQTSYAIRKKQTN